MTLSDLSQKDEILI